MSRKPAEGYVLKTTAIVLLLAMAALAAGPHLLGEHDHGKISASDLVLNDGRPWSTDEALRTGMERIRDGAAPLAASGSTPPLAADQAAALSAAISQHVDFLIANCKLEPKADAALHVLLADLVDGAKALAADPGSRAAKDRVLGALDQYPRYFDHPGWKALPAAAAAQD